MAISIMLITVDVRLQVLNNLRENIKSFFIPVLVSIKLLNNSISHLLMPHLQISTINKNYEELQKEKIKLYEKIEELKTLEVENQQLRKLATINNTVDYIVEVAEVVDKSFQQQKLIINKGKNSGIRLAQAVINEQGVIGQIINVYDEYSEVGLITSAKVKVPVKVRTTEKKDDQDSNIYFGTVVGNNNDLVEFQHYHQNYTAKLGDELYTSGLTNFFAASLPVAKIIKLEANTGLSGVRILAKPYVQITNVKFVAVIVVKNDFSSWLEEIAGDKRK